MGALEQLGINNFDISTYINSGIQSVFWVVIACIIAGIIIFVWWIFSFTETIIIKEPVGKGFEYNMPGVMSDSNVIENNAQTKKINILSYVGSIHKGKITTKHGVKKLILLSPHKVLKIPDNIFLGLTKKGKKFIELTKISEHIFAPTVLTDEGVTRYIYDESYFSWIVNDMEEDHKKYLKQSFLEKYGNFIATALTLILCMIIIVVVLKEANKLVDTAAQGFGQAATALKESLTACKNQVI